MRTPYTRGMVNHSISGATAFISKIAKQTPSGYGPQMRSTAVRMPTPAAKRHSPTGVVGFEVKSVTRCV